MLFIFGRTQKRYTPAAVEFTEKDQQHLLAAEGWLDLGDLISANGELDEITPELRAHPDVLFMRSEIFERAKKWDKLLALTETLSQKFPNDPDTWISYSKALSNLGKTEEAFTILKSKADEFETDPDVPYQLAVLSCKLGKLDETRTWLKRTFATDLADFYRQTALDEPDLKPFWMQNQLGNI